MSLVDLFQDGRVRDSQERVGKLVDKRCGRLIGHDFFAEKLLPLLPGGDFWRFFFGKVGYFSLVVVTNSLRYIRLVRLHIDVKNLSMCL
jgi:hypothetical protein